MKHLRLAHHFWKEHLKEGDIAIDATCGAGNDTLVLANTCLKENKGRVFGIDLQINAINKTRDLLNSSLSDEQNDRITLIHASHAPLPEEIPQANLIVYNLGYLPDSDRLIKTLSKTSLISLESALKRLLPLGMISVMLYPGHHEGLFESQTILDWASLLPRSDYSLSHHYRPNSSKSPSLLVISKKKI